MNKLKIYPSSQHSITPSQVTPTPLITYFLTQPSSTSKSTFSLLKIASNLSRVQKKAKSFKRKQGEYSQATLNRLDTWLMDESMKNLRI